MKKVLALAAFLAACSSTSPAPAPGSETPAEGETPAAETPAEPEEAPEVFGDPLKKIAPANLADIVSKPDDFNGKTVRTEGIVRAVCQQRGCWMEVRPSAERDGEGLTVRFKGYAFFMPKNARGAKVTVEGKVQVVVMTPEQVKELEAEGGAVNKKNPDGSALSFLLMAYGVEMRGRAR